MNQFMKLTQNNIIQKHTKQKCKHQQKHQIQTKAHSKKQMKATNKSQQVKQHNSG